MITSGTVKFIRPSNYQQGYPGAEVTMNFVVDEAKPEEYKVWLQAAKIEARRTADELVYGTADTSTATDAINASTAPAPETTAEPKSTRKPRTAKPEPTALPEALTAATVGSEPNSATSEQTVVAPLTVIPSEPVQALPTQPAGALTAPLPALAVNGSGAALPQVAAGTAVDLTVGYEITSQTGVVVEEIPLSPLPALAPVAAASPTVALPSATAGGDGDITDNQLKDFCLEHGNRISAVPGKLGQGINYIVKVRTEIAGDPETSVFKFDQAKRREFMRRLALEPVEVSL